MTESPDTLTLSATELLALLEVAGVTSDGEEWEDVDRPDEAAFAGLVARGLLAADSDAFQLDEAAGSFISLMVAPHATVVCERASETEDDRRLAYYVGTDATVEHDGSSDAQRLECIRTADLRDRLLSQLSLPGEAPSDRIKHTIQAEALMAHFAEEASGDIELQLSDAVADATVGLTLVSSRWLDGTFEACELSVIESANTGLWILEPVETEVEDAAPTIDLIPSTREEILDALLAVAGAPGDVVVG